MELVGLLQWRSVWHSLIFHFNTRTARRLIKVGHRPKCKSHVYGLFDDMKHYPALLVGLILVAGCTRSTPLPAGFQPDYGTTVYQTNRPITGDLVSTPLGHTGFRAVVSAMRYTDKNDRNPDFCFISVEHGDPGKDNGSMVCYQRQFPESSIPSSVLIAKAADVISFDSAHRQVIFKLGPTNYTYTLPLTQ
jgi:hypothetical protein